MDQDTLFVVLLFVVVFALIAALTAVLRKNHGKYDERQEIVRGKAARLAIYTVIGCYIAYLFAYAFKTALLAPYALLAFTVSVFLGLAVHSIYCIFKDSYFTDRQKPASFLLLSAGIVLSQTPNCSKIFTGEITLSGNPGSVYWCSFCCMIIFAAVFRAALIKYLLSKKERE